MSPMSTRREHVVGEVIFSSGSFLLHCASSCIMLYAHSLLAFCSHVNPHHEKGRGLFRVEQP
jgi:hypothetical protein